MSEHSKKRKKEEEEQDEEEEVEEMTEQEYNKNKKTKKTTTKKKDIDLILEEKGHDVLVVAPAEKKPSGRKAGADESKFASVRRPQVDLWLKRPVVTDRDEAISQFLKLWTHPSRMVFMTLVPVTALQLEAVWKHPQKSDAWLRARIPRKTGSDGGTLLDWSPYCNPLKQAWRKIYGEFIENDATTHGNEWEKPAGKEYIQMFQKTLNRWYIEQRSYETGFITFLNRKIPLRKKMPDSRYYLPPHAEMWHIGMVVDPFNQWRGASIDGLVTINGIPMLLVEIKCPVQSRHVVVHQRADVLYPAGTRWNVRDVAFVPVHCGNSSCDIFACLWYQC